jgi:hypothetical protein
MAASSQSSVYKQLSYSEDIKNEILLSGGTIVYMKDNIIIASEVSEAEYIELLNNPHIYKLDVLPAKRYGYNDKTTTEIK